MSGPIGSIALCSFAVFAAGCTRSEAAPAKTREPFAACARCHGWQGGGGLALSDGGPTPRNFRDPAFQASRTDDQIKRTIRNGTGTGMPAFGGTFDDAELDALVAKIRSFDPTSRGRSR